MARVLAPCERHGDQPCRCLDREPMWPEITSVDLDALLIDAVPEAVSQR